MTLQEILDQARLNTEIEDFSDQKIVFLLNNYARKIYNQVRRHYPECYLETLEIETVSDASGYDLPSDFWRIEKVYFPGSPLRFRKTGKNSYYLGFYVRKKLFE